MSGTCSLTLRRSIPHSAAPYTYSRALGNPPFLEQTAFRLHLCRLPSSVNRVLRVSRELLGMPPKAYGLTPEQVALSEERKRLKLQKQEKKAELGPIDIEDPRGHILSREWLHLNESEGPPSKGDSSHIVRVMTWNVSGLEYGSPILILDSDIPL